MSFASAEQAGVVYLKPATDLLLSVVRARAVAVQVAAHEAPASALAAPRTQVSAAIHAVDAAHGAAATLGLTGKWQSLRSQIQSGIAAPASTPAKTLSAYRALATGVEALIALDGNNSNMILDPDSDAYYVMDAVLNRVTSLMDTAGQAGDLQTVIATGGRATLTKRLELEDLKSSILTTLANNDPDYASAVTNTHYHAMKRRLGDVVRAVNAIGERVAGSIGSFNAMTAELRAMIGDVSASAGAVSAASQQMSETSREAGRATGEIAHAVSDVAQGAERQVTMIDVARHAAEEVTVAVNESAANAQATAEVGQEARRTAGEGVAAAEQANEAMRSVRDSSAAVTAAIAEASQRIADSAARMQDTITEIAASASELSDTAGALERLVLKFRVSD